MKNYQINHYTLANGDTVIYDETTFEQYNITMKLRGTEHMYGKVEFEIVRGLFERLGKELTETYIKNPSSL